MGEDNAALFGARGGPVVEKMQADTDAICEGNPLARNVRTMLRQMERATHRHGFDHPEFVEPRVFMASRQPGGTTVRYQWLDDETALVRGALTDPAIGAAHAVALVANALEQVRAELPADTVAKAREQGMDFLPGFPVGWQLFGFGIRLEAWTLPPGPMTTPGTPEYRAAFASGMANHPERQNVRQIVLAARDGLTWQVFRREGFEPVCWVTLPEAETLIGGGAAGGLRRMVNAMVLTPSPVPDFVVGTADGTERRPHPYSR